MSRLAVSRFEESCGCDLVERSTKEAAASGRSCFLGRRMRCGVSCRHVDNGALKSVAAFGTRRGSGDTNTGPLNFTSWWRVVLPPTLEVTPIQRLSAAFDTACFRRVGHARGPCPKCARGEPTRSNLGQRHTRCAETGDCRRSLRTCDF